MTCRIGSRPVESAAVPCVLQLVQLVHVVARRARKAGKARQASLPACLPLANPQVPKARCDAEVP
jgi:hypothetical protein